MDDSSESPARPRRSSGTGTSFRGKPRVPPFLPREVMDALLLPAQERPYEALKDIAIALSSLELFRGVPLENLIQLSTLVSITTHEKRSVICRQGSPSTELMVIASGHVDVYIDNGYTPEAPDAEGLPAAPQGSGGGGRRPSDGLGEGEGRRPSDGFGGQRRSSEGCGMGLGRRQHIDLGLGSLIATLDPGVVAGEMAVDHPGKAVFRGASLAARTHVELLVVPGNHFGVHIRPYAQASGLSHAARLLLSTEAPKRRRALVEESRGAIASMGFFAHLPAHVQEYVASKARLQVFPAGSILWLQGQEAARFFVIVSGVVGMYRRKGAYEIDDKKVGLAGWMSLAAKRAKAQMSMLASLRAMQWLNKVDSIGPRRHVHSGFKAQIRGVAMGQRILAMVAEKEAAHKDEDSDTDSEHGFGGDEAPGTPDPQEVERSALSVISALKEATSPFAKKTKPKPAVVPPIYTASHQPRWLAFAARGYMLVNPVSALPPGHLGACEATFGAGDSFGERGLLEEHALRRSTLVAHEPCEVLVLDRDDFRSAITMTQTLDAADPHAIRGVLQKTPAARTPADVQSIVGMVTGTNFFSGLPVAVAENLCRSCFLSRVEGRGHLICRQGSPGDTFVLILTGRVSVHLLADTVAQQRKASGEDFFPRHDPDAPADLWDDAYGPKINELGKGDSFGELALIRAQPRTATVVSLEACEFLVVPKDAFTRAMQSSSAALSDQMDRVDLLRQILPASHFRELVAMAKTLSARHAKLGEVLARAGDGPGQLRVIWSGCCAVMAPSLDPRDVAAERQLGRPPPLVEVASLGPAEYFGEHALLGGGPEPHTIVASSSGGVRYYVAEGKEFLSRLRPDQRKAITGLIGTKAAFIEEQRRRAWGEQEAARGPLRTRLQQEKRAKEAAARERMLRRMRRGLIGVSEGERLLPAPLWKGHRPPGDVQRVVVMPSTARPGSEMISTGGGGGGDVARLRGGAGGAEGGAPGGPSPLPRRRPMSASPNLRNARPAREGMGGKGSRPRSPGPLPPSPTGSGGPSSSQPPPVFKSASMQFWEDSSAPPRQDASSSPTTMMIVTSPRAAGDAGARFRVPSTAPPLRGQARNPWAPEGQGVVEEGEGSLGRTPPRFHAPAPSYHDSDGDGSDAGGVEKEEEEEEERGYEFDPHLLPDMSSFDAFREQPSTRLPWAITARAKLRSSDGLEPPSSRRPSSALAQQQGGPLMLRESVSTPDLPRPAAWGQGKRAAPSAAVSIRDPVDKIVWASMSSPGAQRPHMRVKGPGPSDIMRIGRAPKVGKGAAGCLPGKGEAGALYPYKSAEWKPDKSPAVVRPSTFVAPRTPLKKGGRRPATARSAPTPADGSSPSPSGRNAPPTPGDAGDAAGGDPDRTYVGLGEIVEGAGEGGEGEEEGEQTSERGAVVRKEQGAVQQGRVRPQSAVMVRQVAGGPIEDGWYSESEGEGEAREARHALGRPRPQSARPAEEGRLVTGGGRRTFVFSSRPKDDAAAQSLDLMLEALPPHLEEIKPRVVRRRKKKPPPKKKTKDQAPEKTTRRLARSASIGSTAGASVKASAPEVKRRPASARPAAATKGARRKVKGVMETLHTVSMAEGGVVVLSQDSQGAEERLFG